MEYAGFKASDTGPVKWGEIATKITGDLAKIDKDRQTQRDKVQQSFTTASDKLDDIPKGQNKGFNQFVVDGASGQRDFQQSLAKRVQAGGYWEGGQGTTKKERKKSGGNWVKLNPSTATQMLQNGSQDWAAFAREAKDYNKSFGEMMKRQQPGKAGVPSQAGAYELLLWEEKVDLTDMRNKKIISDPNTGRMSLVTYDDQGRELSKKSLNSINNNENQLADRVDVAKIIKTQFGNAGDFQMWDGEKLVASQTQRTDYGKLKTGIMNSVLSNERNTYSVLTDNKDSNYTGYLGDEGGKDYTKKLEGLAKKLQDQVGPGNAPLTDAEAEEKAKKLMIETEIDEMGNRQPKFTAEQREDAKDYVSGLIDAQAGYKETAPKDKATASGIKEANLDKLALSIAEDSKAAVNNFDFKNFNPKYKYSAGSGTGEIKVMVWDAGEDKWRTQTTIKKGDHEGLSRYHNDYGTTGMTGLRYKNKMGQTTGATSYKRPVKKLKYSPDAKKYIATLHTTDDNADIGLKITEFIKESDPGGNPDVKVAKATKGDYGTLDDSYDRVVTVGNLTAGTLITDYGSPNKSEEAEILAHNEKVMKKALKLYEDSQEKGKKADDKAKAKAIAIAKAKAKSPKYGTKPISR